MDEIERQAVLVEALRKQMEAHGRAELHETHISWVLVGDEVCYKIKKSLDLGFLDFSTLEKRHAACETELELNRRTAPGIYRRVTAIGGSAEEPRPGATEGIIEYAVEMAPFEQSALLNHLLDHNRLPTRLIEQLADFIAQWHQTLPPVATEEEHYGLPQQVAAPMQENFAQIIERYPEQEQPLNALRQWTADQLEALHETLARRMADGFIRPCHGDLHLANIVLLDGEPRPFDAIEFNPGLSHIDLMSEVAFTVMDLDARARPDLGWLYLNRYLSQSGDYDGLKVLRLYLVYRAMVRAKIAAITATQGHPESWDEYLRYRNLAERYIDYPTPRLLLTHGFSASGKSTLAFRIMQQCGAIRLRSDVERKRLFGLAVDERSGSETGGGIYTRDATEQTYTRLKQLAFTILASGYSVIADATFLKQWQRALFSDEAEARGIDWSIITVDAAPEELRSRIERRLAHGRDPSEANLEVLARQLADNDPLTDAEQQHSHHFSEPRRDRLEIPLCTDRDSEA